MHIEQVDSHLLSHESSLLKIKCVTSSASFVVELQIFVIAGTGKLNITVVTILLDVTVT